MDDPERTVIWRRPNAESGVARQPEPEAERTFEPVRTGEPVVNINRPAPYTGPYVAPPTPVQLAVWRAQRVIYYVFGVIEAIIAIRFVLKLIAANPASPFVQGVYGVSWVFDFPFNGVVANSNVGGGSVIEWFSLVAILVYALGSWALAKLVGLLV